MKIVATSTHKDAVKQADGTYLVPDDDEGKALVLKKRTELPKAHPMYDKPAVTVVPAGQSDIVQGETTGSDGSPILPIPVVK